MGEIKQLLFPGDKWDSSSPFEKELEKGGVFIFDPIEFDKEAVGILEEFQKWVKGNPYWTAEEKRRVVADEMRYITHERSWLNRFSGTIPKSWRHWSQVEADLEEASGQGVQLSENLVNAAVLHPHWAVAQAAGKGQRLTCRQLAVLLARDDLRGTRIERIISAQQTRGMSQEDIEKAVGMLEEEKVRFLFSLVGD